MIDRGALPRCCRCRPPRQPRREQPVEDSPDAAGLRGGRGRIRVDAVDVQTPRPSERAFPAFFAAEAAGIGGSSADGDREAQLAREARGALLLPLLLLLLVLLLLHIGRRVLLLLPSRPENQTRGSKERIEWCLVLELQGLGEADREDAAAFSASAAAAAVLLVLLLVDLDGRHRHPPIATESRENRPVVMRGKQRGRPGVPVAAWLGDFDGRELDKPGFHFLGIFSEVGGMSPVADFSFCRAASLFLSLSLSLSSADNHALSPLRLRDRQYSDSPGVREQQEEIARGALLLFCIVFFFGGGRLRKCRRGRISMRLGQRRNGMDTTNFRAVSRSLSNIPARFLPHKTNLHGKLGHRADEAVDPAAEEQGRSGSACRRRRRDAITVVVSSSRCAAAGSQELEGVREG